MQRREKRFEIACPKCGVSFEKDLPTAIFADKPERNEILEGKFGEMTCPECGMAFILNYRFAYTDESKSFMIINDPDFIDKKARLAFSTSLGLIGLDRKNELYKHRLRITYDYPSLKEKILIFEKGLDDRVIELMKYFLVHSDDFAYKVEQIKSFYYGADNKFYLETVLNVGASLDFSQTLYDTIVNNYGEIIKKDLNHLIDRSWAEEFLRTK